MSEPSPARKCPNCGAVLPAKSPEGLCPKCLLLGVAAPTATGGGPVRPTPPALDAVAAAFPQLEILEFVGQGGMGCVFKARQPQLNRLVALKILPEAQAGDAAFAARFAGEAQALAALSHPNIVTIHDFGQAGGFFYLLMEFVDGVNLRQALSGGRFTPEQALAVVPPICDALQYAHERGVVHRDIKPENLLLDRNGRLKIADFGIAKMVAGNGARPGSETQPQHARADEAATAGPADTAAVQHTAAGTPQYMAPEQRTDPRKADHRADIYSLGVVLYEMLTGELPAKRLEPPSSRMCGIEIDVRLDEVVLRALEKSPELRWQTAAELRTQVETIAQSTQSEPERRRTGRRGAVASILALCLPPAFFAWFVLVGHRRSFGIDLDPDAQLWTGLIGFPLSAGLGALLAWAAGMFREPDVTAAADASCRWLGRAVIAAVLLLISVLLMGGGMVMIALVTQDPDWNPAPSEVVFVLVVGNGGLAAAASATLVGWLARQQIQRGPRRLRGWGGASAAAWFWPGVAAGFLILSLPALILAGRSGASPHSAIPSLKSELAARRAADGTARDAAQALDSLPPVVVQTQPPSGAHDVAPGIAEIRVKFSKEMSDGSWSWTTAWADSTPEIVNGPRYDQDRRTCIITVKLEPVRTYAWWLNSEKFQNFKDKDGQGAIPYLLIFQTREEEVSP